MKKQYANSMDEALLKELKLYAAEKDQSLNQVIENALYLWMAISKDKGWAEIADCLPTGSKLGSYLQAVAYHKAEGKKLYIDEDRK